MRIPKVYSDYVEYELFHYCRMKDELETIRADIINSSAAPISDRVRSSNIGKPTEAKAVKLADDRYIKYLQRTIAAIERTLKIKGEDYQDFFNHRYINHKPWQTSEHDLHLGQSAYYNRRRKFIKLVAAQMGLVDPV